MTCSSVLMLTAPFVGSFAMYLLALLDYGDNGTLILYCSSNRAATTSFLVWTLIFVFSVITLEIYLIVLIVAYCRTNNQVEPIPEHAGTASNQVAALEAKMFRKLSRTLAITTIIYFFLEPLRNVVSTLFVSFMPDMMLSVGPYYAWLSFVEGSMYTFTLLFSKQCKQEFGILFGIKQSL